MNLRPLLSAAVPFLFACAADAPPVGDPSALVSIARPSAAPHRTSDPLLNVAPLILDVKQLAMWDAADVIVVARLVAPRVASVDEMDPPRIHHEFGLAVERTLSGSALPPGVVVHYSESDDVKLEETRMIVALRRVQETLPQAEERFVAVTLAPADDALAAALEREPLPEGLAFSVRQVPPAVPQQWVNPYGDGEFDLVVENRGATPVVVPGLETRGAEIAWSEVVTVRDDADRLLPLPKQAVSGDPVQPVVLGPGQSITTRVDVKPFGLVHPAGGYRAEYSFRVGQLRASSFFYYDHAYHGPRMGKV